MIASTGLGRLFSDPLSILYTLPGILIGLTVHEWAHAYVAYRLGDPTARNLGRMTMNPFAHVDLFGFLCLLLMGFGWAKPVPVNPNNFKHYKRDDILVSLAGITMNLITALVFTFVLYIGFFRWNMYTNTAFRSIILSIVTINLSLAVFNLIPVYPLDGSHVLDSLLMHRFPKALMFLHQYGRIILIVLLITGIVSSVLGVAVNALYRLFAGAAIAVLG